jgi:hypothetical protein
VLEPAVSRGPLYATFLAVIYKLRGVPERLDGWASVWKTVRLTQAALDSLVCLAVAFLLLKLEPASRWPAVAGATLYALNPYSLYYCQELLGESLTVFVMAMFLVCLVQANLGRSVGWGVLAGLGLAMVVLSRTEFILFIIPSAAVLAYVARKRVALAYVGTFAVVLLSWTVINGQLTGRYRPTPDAGSGYALFHGTFQTNTNWAGWNQYPPELPVSAEERQEIQRHDLLLIDKHQQGLVGAKEHDRFFLAAAKKQWRERPFSVLANCLVRMPRLWYQNQIQMYPKPEPSGNLLLVYLGFGVVALRHYKFRAIWPLPGILLYLAAIFFPLFVESRYSIPTLPATISLAGLGVAAAFRKSEPGREPPDVVAPEQVEGPRN